ncbi:STAS domain-containing protein [Leptospira perdikensis]|nr:STAS domain-containing protein [Leptospira perdikensis]
MNKKIPSFLFINSKVFFPFTVLCFVRDNMVAKTAEENCYRIESNQLDVYSAAGLEEDMTSIFQKGVTSLYLDFSNVEEVSSSVLGLLLYKKMIYRKQGVSLYLINVNPQIQKILKILNLNGYLLL